VFTASSKAPGHARRINVHTYLGGHNVEAVFHDR
jgi:hypothetical protein